MSSGCLAVIEDTQETESPAEVELLWKDGGDLFVSLLGFNIRSAFQAIRPKRERMNLERGERRRPAVVERKGAVPSTGRTLNDSPVTLSERRPPFLLACVYQNLW